jgi:hypothetical protein
MYPRLFIGSSREAAEGGLLEALRHALDSGLNPSGQAIEIVPWTTSPWKNLSAAVATLVESLVEYSYAVFILSADDELTFRGKKHYAARDNVIFEFGLFLAHLGPERTFLVGPASTSAVPPVSALGRSHGAVAERPLRILTDLGTVYREGKYVIEGPAREVVFEVAGIVAAIRNTEERTSDLNAEGARTELIERLRSAGAEIGKSGRCDAYYSGQFFSRFRDIATLKAKATSRPVQDAVKDLLLYLENFGDLCDVAQLAREQHYRNGVREVWVFSDSPLEFHAAGPGDEGFNKLRETIVENLRNGVEYVYFVGPDFSKDSVEHLVAPREADRAAMLGRIHVVKVPSQLFCTYFTMHFHDRKGPEAIYMSSVMRNRKDLLIQVSDSMHVRRIFERIAVLKGETEHEHAPRVTRFVMR